MIHRNVFAVAIACVLQWTVLANLTAAELSHAEFQRLCALLQPSPDQPWRTIPWKINLLDAQQAAAEQQKPIFIWAMDGHPLGCT